jgi:uncharacterized protein (DUF2249 family)
MNEFK